MDTINNMSSKEYMGWIEYFRLRPYGWREDYRTSLIAQTTFQGSKPLKIHQLFPSLAALEKSQKREDPNKTAAMAFLKGIASKNNIKWGK
tara:strand:+ start:1462 stop:1731 length:270 start_codon:yes stop_codon:yes gene_type:complete